MLNYRSRYTHRVAIFNEHIVAVDAEGVRVRVRVHVRVRVRLRLRMRAGRQQGVQTALNSAQTVPIDAGRWVKRCRRFLTGPHRHGDIAT